MVTVRSQDNIWFIVQALTEMKSLEYWKRCQLLIRNVLGVIRLYTTVKIFCDCCWTIKIRLGSDLRNYTHKSNIQRSKTRNQNRFQNPFLICYNWRNYWLRIECHTFHKKYIIWHTFFGIFATSS